MFETDFMAIHLIVEQICHSKQPVNLPVAREEESVGFINVKFHVNPSSNSRDFIMNQSDGPTDTAIPISADTSHSVEPKTYDALQAVYYLQVVFTVQQE